MQLWPSSEVARRTFSDPSPLTRGMPEAFLSRVLITTDVWARGIDVQQVSLVINYDLPAYGFLCRIPPNRIAD